jgi:hypothetical protein
MTMMTYEAFSARLTAGRAPILAGGICPAGARESCASALGNLSRLEFATGEDPRAIDEALAASLRKWSHPDTLVAGACVRVAGQRLLTGGVIGPPAGACTPADGKLREVAPGLFFCAYPGGPGYAVGRDQDGATEIWRQVRRRLLPNGIDRAGLLACFSASGAQPYMVLLDGSGEDALGLLAHSTPAGIHVETLGPF